MWRGSRTMFMSYQTVLPRSSRRNAIRFTWEERKGAASEHTKSLPFRWGAAVFEHVFTWSPAPACPWLRK